MLMFIYTRINRQKPSINHITWSYLDIGHLSALDIKGKAVPLQVWAGPGDARRLRLPDFMTIST